MSNWSYQQYKIDREDRKRKQAERDGYPNRRGDYREDNSSLRKEKWKRNRVRLFKNKWQVVDAPDFRHNYKSGARHSWAHSIGTRNRRKWKQEREAQQVGFQLTVERKKPKIPGRVLRDAQEEELWLEEQGA